MARIRTTSAIVVVLSLLLTGCGEKPDDPGRDPATEPAQTSVSKSCVKKQSPSGILVECDRFFYDFLVDDCYGMTGQEAQEACDDYAQQNPGTCDYQACYNYYGQYCDDFWEDYPWQCLSQRYLQCGCTCHEIPK